MPAKTIDAEVDDVALEKVSPRSSSSTKMTGLPRMRRQSPALIEVPLDVDIEVERTIGGVEMGVLQNGMPYLTPSGLEEAAGVPSSTLFEISREWEAAMKSGAVARQSRIAFFYRYLGENGYTHPHLYIEIIRKDTPYYACPDLVCMAFLEYFAFETLKNNATAVMNYRNFARLGFHGFVYSALDYTPPDKWKYLHDSISMQSETLLEGYFIVFSEVTGMIVDLINADLFVTEKAIPVIGVEKNWADHWAKNYFDDVYGARITAVRNPQLPWAYPDEALAEFRRWFRHEYLTTRFPRYMLTRAHVLAALDKPKNIESPYQPRAVEAPRSRKRRTR